MPETKQTLGREEEADLMLKNTTITPGLARFLAGAFVLMICTVPFLHHLSGSPQKPAQFSRSMMNSAMPRSAAALSP